MDSLKVNEHHLHYSDNAHAFVSACGCFVCWSQAFALAPYEASALFSYAARPMIHHIGHNGMVVIRPSAGRHVAL